MQDIADDFKITRSAIWKYLHEFNIKKIEIQKGFDNRKELRIREILLDKFAEHVGYKNRYKLLIHKYPKLIFYVLEDVGYYAIYFKEKRTINYYNFNGRLLFEEINVKKIVE